MTEFFTCSKGFATQVGNKFCAFKDLKTGTFKKIGQNYKTLDAAKKAVLRQK